MALQATKEKRTILAKARALYDYLIDNFERDPNVIGCGLGDVKSIAEVYLPGYGWIPIDPADVRKIMLNKKIQKIENIKEYREYYFGAVDENRIQFGYGRDIILS